MKLLNGMLFLQLQRVISNCLLLVAIAVTPSLSYGDPIINVTRLADDATDLHVYSANNEYTDLDQYTNLRFRTYITASNFDASVNTFSVRANPWTDLGGEYQVNIGPRSADNFTLLDVKSVSPNTQYNWVINGEIPHRLMAAFAINVCNANIERKLGFARSRANLFTEDYTLGMYMQYAFSTRFDNGSGYPTPTQNFRTTQVHSERKVICHKSVSQDSLPRPPATEFVVRNVTIDILPLIQDASQSCNVATKIEIKTNQPNRTVSYYVQQQKGTEARPGSSTRHGPYQLQTDRNGVASGRFDATDVNRGLDRGNFAVGHLRVVGDSDVFQSPRISYRVDCDRRPNLTTGNIGPAPVVQIPRNQLPGNRLIIAPDAPDSRLIEDQSTERLPSVKKLNPNNKLKQPSLPKNVVTIKPISPNNKTIDNKLKQKQSIEKNTKSTISQPVSDKEIQPILKK